MKLLIKLSLAILILFFSFTNTAFAQLGWNLQWTGTTNTLSSITFISDNTGFCVGYNGTLLKTTNAGTVWISQLTGTNNWLRSIHFPNAVNGYITGDGGIFLKSSNAGANWELWPTITGEGQTCIYFINTSTGFISTASGSILKTTNNGNNWNTNYTIGGYLTSVFFVNQNAGYVTGTVSNAGVVYKTTNGGNSWINLTVPYVPGISCVYFPNTGLGFIVGSSGFTAKTTNEGSNWTTHPVGIDKFLTSVYFVSDLIGYSVGQDGIIIKSLNSGSNWVIQQNLATSFILRDVYFLNSLTGYAAGDNGTIIKTTTGGIPVGVKRIDEKIPLSFSLYQNYPNPFNPATRLKFDIMADGKRQKANVKLIIYNILGKEIEVIVNKQLSPGTYEISWDASNFTSGIYFLKMVAKDSYGESVAFISTIKMLLIR